MLTSTALTLRAACEFVAEKHRHHKPPQGHKFSIGAIDREGKLVGVCIAGRPVARALDDGRTLEVTRLCTDGTKNAPSFLLGCAARAGAAIGYLRIFTYTLCSEPGTSLVASGWSRDGVMRPNGRGWSNRPNRGELHPEPKIRWVKWLGEARCA